MYYSFLALLKYKKLAVNAIEADLQLLKVTRKRGYIVC